jgi:hypothetical protein
MDQEGGPRLQHQRPTFGGTGIPGHRRLFHAIRYPADFPETLPGDEARALEVAGRVKNAVMTVLDPYLSGA